MSAPEVAEKIKSEHGETTETRKTAESFLEVRDDLIDSWPVDENGDKENIRELDEKLDKIEAEFLHDILEDYSIMLQHEMEYLSSNEIIEESIRANCYTFRENGKREG